MNQVNFDTLLTRLPVRSPTASDSEASDRAFVAERDEEYEVGFQDGLQAAEAAFQTAISDTQAAFQAAIFKLRTAHQPHTTPAEPRAETLTTSTSSMMGPPVSTVKVEVLRASIHQMCAEPAISDDAELESNAEKSSESYISFGEEVGKMQVQRVEVKQVRRPVAKKRQARGTKTSARRQQAPKWKQAMTETGFGFAVTKGMYIDGEIKVDGKYVINKRQENACARCRVEGKDCWVVDIEGGEKELKSTMCGTCNRMAKTCTD